jgi:hypothetical protein
VTNPHAPAKSRRVLFFPARSDEDAEAFARRFVQRRGGVAFKEMVRQRAQKADELFSSDGRNGSSTLRGKLVILFGNPAQVHVSPLLSTRRSTGIPPPIAITEDSRSNYGRDPHSTGKRGQVAGYVRHVTLTFAAQNVPGFEEPITR